MTAISILVTRVRSFGLDKWADRQDKWADLGIYTETRPGLSLRWLVLAPIGCVLVPLFLAALYPWHGVNADMDALAATENSAAYQALVNSEPMPSVAPLELPQLPYDHARAINAATPFVNGPISAAAPFITKLNGDDRARAVDCLGAAMWYEAGADWEGQRAVAQVVLNRVRHPAFPHSVCGVAFQGSDRKTGCQFTFACDGAMARRPPDWAWVPYPLAGAVGPEWIGRPAGGPGDPLSYGLGCA